MRRDGRPAVSAVGSRAVRDEAHRTRNPRAARGGPSGRVLPRRATPPSGSRALGGIEVFDGAGHAIHRDRPDDAIDTIPRARNTPGRNNAAPGARPPEAALLPT